MALTNSPALYGSVTKTFHWLTALLIFTAFPLGMIANDFPMATSDEVAQKAWLFSLHKTVGVTLFFVAVLRILWATTQPKPGLLNADNPAEATAAEAVHWLLYFSLVLVPLSGWLHHSTAAFSAPILWPFSAILPELPKSELFSHITSGWHGVFTKLLLASLILHIAGALKHAFIDRDSTLKRMLPGKMSTPTLPQQRHSKTPLVIAVALYGVAMGVGTFLGLQTPAAAQTNLADVQSDWTVESGNMAVTVQQLGSAVTGSFADWTADIAFDPTLEGDKKGRVEVTVAIASFTLGSVTDQAMGSDFFDATTFPTAVYAADIFATGDTYEARGTLTLKGTTLPLTLPFTLSIEDDVATMAGAASLARLDYSIGAAMPDESSLGFDVDLKVDLVAFK
ncbi:cytochrome b/b6 domain-containing protein [Falsihalocynthiibacter sp. CO-5D18]|uniref:cytochrome b/b6 domain-containing protein n=1 Tax=Falsihalocynthiibacter sp. CO-5D18 TaxID=3240872 RepID=UPI00350F3475